MFYSFLFFCIGGLLFLYKENIIKVIKKGRIVNLILLLLSFIIFSINFHNKYILIIQVILFSVLFVTYSISFDKSSLNNKFTKFIGSISMEIYLSHMVIYRILEKINLLHIIENDYIQYIISFLLIVIGTIILAKLFDFFWNKIEKRLLQNENTIS